MFSLEELEQLKQPKSQSSKTAILVELDAEIAQAHKNNTFDEPSVMGYMIKLIRVIACWDYELASNKLKKVQDYRDMNRRFSRYFSRQ